MKQQILNRLYLVIAIALIAGAFSAPTSFYQSIFGQDSRITQFFEAQKVTLGLDLAGGTELDYQIDLTEPRAMNADEDLENNVNIDEIAESVRDALEARVNPAGIGEIIVKRSQINGEEHVLIQMPPSSNVAEAKADAERDNRLEFYEEDSDLVTTKRLQAGELIQNELTNGDWETASAQILENDEIAQLEKFGPVSESEISDPTLLEALKNTEVGQVAQTLVETTIAPSFEVTESGEVVIDGSPFPRSILAIPYVVEKTTGNVEQELPEEASARHILIGYPGASNAPEDLPYETKADALAKANELLNQIKDGGDFTTLAQEFSTGPSAEEGGDLGTFNPGMMVGPFNDAVFDRESVGLIDEVIETPFGFHVIEVTDYKSVRTETVEESNITYEMITWDLDEIPWVKTPLGGAQLDIARPGYDEVGNALVDLRFNREGQNFFGEITERLAGKTCNDGPCRLQIRVGGEPVTTPTVREKILTANAQITGNFTAQSSQDLANNLNLGAIQAPVQLSNETKIQAELGAEQLDQSIKAALYGFIGTIIFMILMYRIPGVVAALSLTLYTLLYIMLLKTWPESFGGPVVLSLSGAAGIALSIGLAVDGNILIFERTKEEIRKGKPLLQAIDLGFERAWSAIRDSNLTTLITCIILFSLGSSVIKGFAVTLIVGTLLSMFTAITVSRNLLRSLIVFGIKKPELFGIPTEEVGKKTTGPKIRKRQK